MSTLLRSSPRGDSHFVHQHQGALRGLAQKLPIIACAAAFLFVIVALFAL
ncbi:hypothetical protein [Rhizobium paknamense]|uniref:Uncharacterized protein n=1 Tax=Rhizobium paknamense TaxID=1206817 RepID=A0ABU0IGA0_9HYPH|nr:hypothetical protein [Rhizobium paknamense]MDQ0456440.1 hypothetical protein [Rhizobium paknamense]